MRRWARRLTGLALATALTATLMACASAAPAAPPPGFVGADARGFTVDGAVRPLVGINIYNAASRGNCWYDMRGGLGPALERVGSASGGRADVIRVWFFQRLAVRDGRRDWTELDRVVATARQQGFRVIPVLTDQWGACEGQNGTGGPYKDISWYEGGYRDAARGDGTVSYRDWVGEVVSRYRDDNTVAMWSLVNEAEARSVRSGPCPAGATDALASFADDVGSRVRDLDPSHLVGLGTIGGGQCGASGDEYRRLHAIPSIGFCEYHDYDLGPLPGDPYNGLLTRLRDCQGLGKPMLIGESGVLPADVGGLAGRAEEFRQKLDAQRRAGAAGFLMWGWSNNGYGPDDEYGIGPGDPSLPVLAD